MMPTSLITRLAIGAGLLALLVSAFVWARADAYSDGADAKDAEWMAATVRIQKATVRASDAAAKLARAREEQDANLIEDLKHEAAKGDGRSVGPGVASVIERLRAEGSHRAD